MQRDEKQRKLLVIGYGPCGKTSLISRYVNQSSARAVLSSPSELPSSELASVPSVLLSEVNSGYDPTIVERYCRQDTITLPQDKVPLNNMMIAVESEAISNPIQAITFIVTIIDTSGNDEFESLVLPEHVDCDAFLILYAVDDIMSFERIARFRQLIVSTRMKDESRTNDSGGQIHHLPPVVLVGNKSDLPVEQWRVSKEMADSCAQNYYKNCSHAPVNALLNTIPVLHRHISAHFSCLLDVNEIFHAVLRALMVKNGCPFPHHEEKHLGVLDCQALGSESLKVQQQEQQRGFTYVPGRSIGIVPEEVYMAAVKERPSNVVDQDDDAEALPPPDTPPPDTPPPEDDDDDDEEQKDVSTPASMNGCKSNVRVLPHATAKESVPDRTAQKKCDRIPEESKPCDRKQKNHALKTESFEKTGDKQENRMNDKVALLNYKYSTPPSDGHFSYDSEGSLYHPINSCDTQGTRRTEIERFLPMQSHSKTNIFKKAWEVITCGCC